MALLEIPVSQTVLALDAAYVAHDAAMAEKNERFYLGMSGFGTDCDRKLWYGWHKAHPPEKFSGRMLRLFGTGHREEDRMVADLIRAGVAVEAVGPDGKQWEVKSIGGHFSGHLDGICTNVPEAPKTIHVLEIKTHNQKSFDKLLKEGVKKSKPGHYRQMQFYMHHKGIQRALYLAKNKNDDTYYAERVEYDPVAALQFMARAERIVRASRPPPKLNEDPDAKMAFECRTCPAIGVCHKGEFALRNCRTCIHSEATVDESRSDAPWYCHRYECEISVAEQKVGCDLHRYIPELVPGDQIDCDPEAELITYKMRDGSEWIDRGAE